MDTGTRSPLTASAFVAALRAREPLTVSHAVIDGDVELDAVDYPHPLVVRDTVFRGRFDVSESHFARRLDFTGCTFERSVSFCRAQVDGRLVLESVAFPRDEPSTKVDMRRIQIAGDLLARGLRCGRELDLEYAQISGSVVLASTPERQTVCDGLVDLRGVRVLGDLNLRGVSTGGDLRMVGADIAGWMLLDAQADHRTHIGGALWLYTTRIGGKLVLGEVEVAGDLLADGAQIIEGVYGTSSKNRTGVFAGSVSFQHAKISGDVTMSGVQVARDLNLADAVIQGAVSLHDERTRAQVGGSLILMGTSVTGPVMLSGACIGGALIALNAALQRDLVADALVGDRTEIGESVLLSGARIDGSVGLRGARIGGDVTLDGAQIGAGLVAAAIAGGHRTEVAGDIGGSGTAISGNLVLDGVLVKGIVFLTAAQIQGSVSCGALGDQRTQASHVLLPSAKISGAALFKGTKIAGALNLAQAELEGLACDGPNTAIGGPIVFQGLRANEFRLDGWACPAGPVDLSLAKIDRLEIVEHVPARIDLTGCEFRRLILPGQDHRGLLRSTTPFQRDPYFAMEKWLRDRGEDDRANEVYLDLRRRHRAENLSGLRRLADWALDRSVGYGIESYRLAVYLALVCLLSALLFSHPGAMQPDPVSAARPSESTAVWLAAQTTFPMFAVIAAKSWRPSSQPIVLFHRPLPLSYDDYASVVSLLSWVVVPLFIAGMTGLLKKQKA
jgi:hypothetical protein